MSEDQYEEEAESDTVLPATLCHVNVVPAPAQSTNWPPFPAEHMRTTVSLLGGEVMKRWGHFLKKIHVDSSTSILPAVPPAKKGQLLYHITINDNPAVALLDHRASYCFMAREWALEKRFHMEPLPRPRTFSFFNGTHDSITHLVRGASVQIGTHQAPLDVPRRLRHPHACSARPRRN